MPTFGPIKRREHIAALSIAADIHAKLADAKFCCKIENGKLMPPYEQVLREAETSPANELWESTEERHTIWPKQHYIPTSSAPL